jgi:uncharacterized integral membrane protein
MRWARRIALIALLVALPVGVHLFVSRNSHSVPIDYLAGRWEAVEVWLLLLSAFGAGFGLAAFIAMLRGARLRLEARRYRRATRDLESEVHQLRNLPLSDTGGLPLPDEAGADPVVAGPGAPNPDPFVPASGLERGT